MYEGTREATLTDVYKLLYEIYCRLQNIEYYNFRISTNNSPTIERIDIVNVGTSPQPIVEAQAVDRVVRIYNMSFSSPQILYVNHNGINIGIPINAGEYLTFAVREAKKLFAWYEAATENVVIAYLTV